MVTVLLEYIDFGVNFHISYYAGIMLGAFSSYYVYNYTTIIIG